MTKMEVVKNWKPAFKSLGFDWKKGAFYSEKSKDQSLQFMIAIQKNLHADTYKVNPTIILRNPFVENAQEEVLVRGNLRREGIRLHEVSASWWPTGQLAEALQLLEKYAPAWFQEWGRPDHLAHILETAIKDEKDFLDVAEPLPQAATRAPWHQEPPAKRKIPPMYFYQAATLHYLNHDVARAIARTRDWIASLRTGDEDERPKAEAQLSALLRTSSHYVQ